MSKSITVVTAFVGFMIIGCVIEGAGYWPRALAMDGRAQEALREADVAFRRTHFTG
jgi:hypothetical protein